MGSHQLPGDQPSDFYIGENSFRSEDHFILDAPEIEHRRMSFDLNSVPPHDSSESPQDPFDPPGLKWLGNDDLGNLGFDMTATVDSAWSPDLFWQVFDAQPNSE
jgi:hypothetical protein